MKLLLETSTWEDPHGSSSPILPTVQQKGTFITNEQYNDYYSAIVSLLVICTTQDKSKEGEEKKEDNKSTTSQYSTPRDRWMNQDISSFSYVNLWKSKLMSALVGKGKALKVFRILLLLLQSNPKLGQLFIASSSPPASPSPSPSPTPTAPATFPILQRVMQCSTGPYTHTQKKNEKMKTTLGTAINFNHLTHSLYRKRR